MPDRIFASYGIAITWAVAVSVGLSVAWWCSVSCGTIGWIAILGIFFIPAAMVAFAVSFFLADKAGRFISVPIQVLAATFLPWILINLWYLPHNLDQLHGDFGLRSHAWVLWHVFQTTALGALVTIPGGLLGGLALFCWRIGLPERS